LKPLEKSHTPLFLMIALLPALLLTSFAYPQDKTDQNAEKTV